MGTHTDDNSQKIRSATSIAIMANELGAYNRVLIDNSTFVN